MPVEKKEFFVNVNMTIKLNSISSMKYIRQAINDGMEFEGTEGIIYYDMDVEEEQPNMNDLMAARDDG